MNPKQTNSTKHACVCKIGVISTKQHEIQPKKKLEFAKLEKFTSASFDFAGAGVRPIPVAGNRQQHQPTRR